MSGGRAAVITGRGVLSPIGVDWPSFAFAVRAGHESEAAPFSGASAADPVLCHLLSAPVEADRLSEPLASLATAAVRAALTEAGIRAGGLPLDEIGLVMNTALGPSNAVESFLEQLQAKGPRSAHPALFVDTLLSMPASRVSIALKLRGSTAVLGGSSAFELALDWLRAGREHTVIAGGADYQSPKCLRYHGVLAGRSGARRAHLAQGAAFMVLESAERAASRGAASLGELLGVGAAAEPQEVSVPWSADPEGASLARSMRTALEDAGVQPAAVRMLVVAAGDDASEQVELAAVDEVFGAAAGSLELIRPKRLLGETLGAAAGIAMLAALAGLEEGLPAEPRHAVVNAFEMGGAVSSLVLKTP